MCGKGGWDSGEIETISGAKQDQNTSAGGKGGWDSGEIETHQPLAPFGFHLSGKGGWDSGEIETRPGKGLDHRE